MPNITLQRCLADISGPFYDPRKPFRNWSSLPFYQLDQPHPPYVDQTQLDWGVERAIAHVAELHAQGYTGIVIDNLAHIVDFAGTAMAYPDRDPYQLRAARYRAAFMRLFQAASARGMEIFVTTDMQWSTPPLRNFVRRMVPDNPQLADANRWALNELFTTFPQVSGIVVRVGETGGAHDQGGYQGHLMYRTPQALRDLIGVLLPVCERHNRLLVVRTWSVGIGKLGDLLWSPERYQAVFAGIRSNHLMTSIKHGPADFFRFLPTNQTLGLPGPRQIVELQNRREYELFGMVPSSVAQLHSHALQTAAVNPQSAGIWAWNSTGGWGGGTAAIGDRGWSVWTQLSSAITAALARDPLLDSTVFIRDWCCAMFGSSFGPAVAAVYAESAELLTFGWYAGKPHKLHTLGPLYLPPLLWVWWMRPTAAPLIWSLLAAMLDDHRQVLQASQVAAERAAWHAQHLEALAPAGDPQAGAVVASIHYMADVLAVAQAIRGYMLPAFAAALCGDFASWEALLPRVAVVRTVLARHHAKWRNRADLPALELAEIDTYLKALERQPRRFWLQARVAAAVVRQARGNTLRRRAYATVLLAAVLVGFGLARKGAWRPGTAVATLSMLLVPLISRHVMPAALPWLNRRYYLLPSIFFETGPSIGEWS